MPSSIPTESTRGALGQGLYSLGDLRVYVAFEGEVRDGERVLDWLQEALNPVRHRARQPDYSFSDLISLFVVRELRRRGVPSARIRAAEQHLREKWQTDRPFVSERIATDGRHVFAGDEMVSDPPEQIEAASLGGQQTMLAPIRDELVTVEYHRGRADSWRPMEHIVLDPDIQFGEPVIQGTRLPTAAIASAVAQSDAMVVAERYRIPEDAAAAAAEFQRKLQLLRARL